MNINKLICLLFLFSITTNCKEDDNINEVSNVLLISPVNIGETYNVDTNLIGNVNMFIGFGQTIDIGLPTEHISPAFEYITEINAKVYSASYGIISSINFQEESQDYELHVVLNEYSTHLIIYDHVKNLEVGHGDTVSPGDLLGTVGDWGETLGRTELQVNVGNLHICPTKLGNNIFNNDHSRLVNSLNINSLTTLTSACLADELNE